MMWLRITYLRDDSLGVSCNVSLRMKELQREVNSKMNEMNRNPDKAIKLKQEGFRFRLKDFKALHLSKVD